MKTINIREFTQNVYKYLKDKEDIVVTKNRKPVFRVTFDLDVATLFTKEEPIVATNLISSPHRGLTHYGCGCVRGEDRLCKKHGRV